MVTMVTMVTYIIYIVTDIDYCYCNGYHWVTTVTIRDYIHWFYFLIRLFVFRKKNKYKGILI